jgi:hypothetical protein
MFATCHFTFKKLSIGAGFIFYFYDFASFKEEIMRGMWHVARSTSSTEILLGSNS